MEEPIVAMEIYIRLFKFKPTVSRVLLVPLTLRYDQLHVLIQLAYGWNNSHPYSFKLEHSNTFPSDDNYLYQDIKKKAVIYTYGFETEWKHKISLKKLLTFAELNRHPLPYCLQGSGDNHAKDSIIPGQNIPPFNKEQLNSELVQWSHAGKNMIPSNKFEYDPYLPF